MTISIYNRILNVLAIEKNSWVWKSIAQQEERECAYSGEVLRDQGQKVYVISQKEHFLPFNRPDKLEM